MWLENSSQHIIIDNQVSQSQEKSRNLGKNISLLIVFVLILDNSQLKYDSIESIIVEIEEIFLCFF
jgi:hypothetical protein